MNDSAMNLTKTILLGGALLASNSLWAIPQSDDSSEGTGCCVSTTAPACPPAPTIEEQAADEAPSLGSADTAFTPAAQELLENYLIKWPRRVGYRQG